MQSPTIALLLQVASASPDDAVTVQAHRSPPRTQRDPPGMKITNVLHALRGLVSPSTWRAVQTELVQHARESTRRRARSHRPTTKLRQQVCRRLIRKIVGIAGRDAVRAAEKRCQKDRGEIRDDWQSSEPKGRSTSTREATETSVSTWHGERSSLSVAELLVPHEARGGEST
jgi:endonuclease III